MKELNEIILCDDCRYTDDHEWCKAEGETVKVGISDFAQDQLGDIVFVELPEVGASFDSGETFGVVESVKAVSDCFVPFACEIVAINEDLEDAPESVNEDPYGAWIIEVKPADMGDFEALMDVNAYKEHLKGAE